MFNTPVLTGIFTMNALKFSVMYPSTLLGYERVGYGASAFGELLRARQQHATQSAVRLIGLELDIDAAETPNNTFS